MSEATHGRCAFLSMARTEGYSIDDDLVHGPLRDLGIEVDTVAWDQDGVNWNRYDLVVVRSTWDYQDRAELFVSRLREIDASTRLENALSIMRWNLDKSYLLDLAAQGIPTIPTLWRPHLKRGDLRAIVAELESDSVIVKPLVGASAQGAWHLTADNLKAISGQVEGHYRDRPLLVQRFMDSVVTEGEYSLIYLDGEFSHALLKTPRAGDFRSQEEHGGRVRSILATADLRRAGRKALACVSPTPLYARVDFLRAPAGEGLRLIELELVEPSLYLRTDPAAAGRLARAVARRSGRGSGGVL